MSESGGAVRAAGKSKTSGSEREKTGGELEAPHLRPGSSRALDLFFTPAEISEEKLKTYKNVVVIDVLRTATSIAAALSNGARDILPAASISAATSLASHLDRDDVLLCGEREGRLIDGFHLGNSPADYSRERVRGRTLIFGSTNGTPAIVKASVASSVLLCGFVNLPSVLEVLFDAEEPFPMAVLCAGKQNRFCIEDAVAGGMLVERICSRTTNEPTLNDAARVSILLRREFGDDTLALLYSSDHGRYLISIGMEMDLPICASLGVLPVVPVLKDSKLMKWE